MIRGRAGAHGVVLLVLAACGVEENVGPQAGYAELAARVTAAIEYEMEDKDLPALSIALVDGAEVVWAQGFGMEDPDAEVPATARTVYRVGSVSKLFTDLGVMQLVRRGELDLDAPVTHYVDDFRPAGGVDVTLRQLTSHRAGLVREPPTGHYFDDTEPTLAETVASLNGTGFVYAPTTRSKYSNAGIAVVGYVLERMRGQPFAAYLEAAVLSPLGMHHSSFAPDPRVVDRLATAYMWTYDGRRFEAPTFQLGMAPAGSMYAPVTDLATFMIALFAGGVSALGDTLIDSASLEEMWTPQFAPAGAETGYGIGFRVGRMAGERSIGHGGAIYGFATDLAALPDQRVGVVSVTTMDGANTVVSRINRFALASMLAARRGDPAPEYERTEPVPDSVSVALAGSYVDRRGAVRVEIAVRSGEVTATFPERMHRLRYRAGDLVVDDRLGFGRSMKLIGGGLVLEGGTGDTLRRRESGLPPAVSPNWRGLIGEFGWDHNILFVYEHRGRLHALVEWFYISPLEEIAPDTFRFPDDRGLYHGEQLVFTRDAGGRATSVDMAGVTFVRREIGTLTGETFTIEPVRPVAELRAEALAAVPPPEEGARRDPDLVELRSLDSTIRYDIRYATTNNFMQSVFYDEALAYLQRPAAEALVRAHRRLAGRGYGLLIHDAYRPWYVTKMFWDATPADLKDFVANPAYGSRHNRGAAVDLTLYDRRTGDAVEMVGGYDEFSARSFPDYPGGTHRQRWLRGLLRDAMEAQGFAVYEYEWWHFDYGDWARYPILNAVFSELGGDER